MPVSTMTDAEIATYTAKRWDEFCKDEDIKRDFGFDAFAERVKRKANVDQVSQASPQQILRALGDTIVDGMQAGLNKAYQMRMKENMPRAKQTPNAVNENILDANLRDEVKAETAPWLKDVDFASNPIRDFMRAAQDPNVNRDKLTTMFDAARQDLQNQLELKYKKSLQPRFTAQPAPDNKLR